MPDAPTLPGLRVNPLAPILLDADPERVLGSDRRDRAKRAAATGRFLDALASTAPRDAVTRIVQACAADPEFGSSPAVWQWVRLVLTAAQSGDPLRFEESVEAMPAPGRRRRGFAAWGLALDEGESLFRDPVTEHFDFPEPDGQWHSALAATLELAAEVAPRLTARFGSILVPVRGGQNVQRSATYSETPGVTYVMIDSPPCELLASLAHEEAHAILNCAERNGDVLPDNGAKLSVPWKPVKRALPAVIHGLAAFSRAATVRLRNTELAPCSDCDARRRHEVAWVRSVSCQLREGAMGVIDEAILAWLDLNEEQMGLAEPDRRDRASLPGPVSGDGAFRWALRDHSVRDLAGRSYLYLSRGTWSREVESFYKQDVIDLLVPDRVNTPEVAELLELATGAIARDAAALARRDVRLVTLRAHRHRPGDAISAHTDASGEDGVAVRAVLGITPELEFAAGGWIELLNEGGSAFASCGPAFGATFLFEVSPGSRHRLSTVIGPEQRYAVVASYKGQ